MTTGRATHILARICLWGASDEQDRPLDELMQRAKKFALEQNVQPCDELLCEAYAILEADPPEAGGEEFCRGEHPIQIQLNAQEEQLLDESD